MVCACERAAALINHVVEDHWVVTVYQHETAVIDLNMAPGGA
jgi:hypothetical protein